MTIDMKNLPNDITVLHQLVLGLVETLKNKDEELKKLRHHLALLRRNHYGRKSEKCDRDQLDLAFAMIEAALGKKGEGEPAPEEKEPEKDKKKGHGRRPLPGHLPRQRIEHPVDKEKLVCKGCGGRLEKIGEEVSEQLEYIPASFYVKQHVRMKYACKCCQENVVISEYPSQPVEKGIPGPGLIAHVITSKYCDHLPLNRQEMIFKRNGLDIRRSTLADWVKYGSDLLEPLYKTMKNAVLKSKKIHTDDIPVPVQDPLCQGTKTGRLWVYSGDEDHPYDVYDYTADRSSRRPKDFLDGYKGYLQADAYKGYDNIYEKCDVMEVACWAHARRKFFDSQETDREYALTALADIRKLYDVEDEAKGKPPREIKCLRQEKSKPLLDAFEKWMKEAGMSILPKSPMGQAISYALSNWEALNAYTADGDLDIDNNAAERALRCIAVGRKNWLFAGSDAGGRRAAILYTMVSSCKRHGVDPWAYMADVLDKVSSHPARLIDELLPDKWKSLKNKQSASSPEA